MLMCGTWRPDLRAVQTACFGVPQLQESSFILLPRQAPYGYRAYLTPMGLHAAGMEVPAAFWYASGGEMRRKRWGLGPVFIIRR